jgi:hypothetical protein
MRAFLEIDPKWDELRIAEGNAVGHPAKQGKVFAVPGLKGETLWHPFWCDTEKER